MYFYFAHISKWQEVLGSFLSIKKIDFSFYFLCILICFSYFLYLFSLGLILIISSVLFSKSLFQWPWLICYWTFYWIFNFNYGISHLQKFCFILFKICLLFNHNIQTLFYLLKCIQHTISHCGSHDSGIWSHWGSDSAVLFFWLLLFISCVCLFGWVMRWTRD